jgi:hypothetical protein
VDLNRTLDSTFSKVNPIETKVKEVKTKDGSYQEIYTKVPLTEEEAGVIASQRGLTFVPSIQSTAREIIADPTLRSQYADTYNIDPQDEQALTTSIMNEGRKFVEENIKRRNLGNQNVKVFVNTVGEQPAWGWNKSVQDLATGGFNTASAGVLGLESEGFSTIKSGNLFNQKGEEVASGTLDKQVVNEFRIMPVKILDAQTNKRRPAKKGEKPDGFETFVMFGMTGSKFFLPLEDFSFTGLLKDGKDVTQSVKASTNEMQAYADQLTQLYTQERRKEGAIKNAYNSGNIFLLTNELKKKIK